MQFGLSTFVLFISLLMVLFESSSEAKLASICRCYAEAQELAAGYDTIDSGYYDACPVIAHPKLCVGRDGKFSNKESDYRVILSFNRPCDQVRAGDVPISATGTVYVVSTYIIPMSGPKPIIDPKYVRATKMSPYVVSGNPEICVADPLKLPAK